MARQWFSDTYAARIFVKIWRICEFRIIMGIMTVLLGCCLSSTLGSRANDYVKTLAIWLHHLSYPSLATQSLSPKYEMINVSVLFPTPSDVSVNGLSFRIGSYHGPPLYQIHISNESQLAAEFWDYQLILLVVFGPWMNHVPGRR